MGKALGLQIRQAMAMELSHDKSEDDNDVEREYEDMSDDEIVWLWWIYYLLELLAITWPKLFKIYIENWDSASKLHLKI